MPFFQFSCGPHPPPHPRPPGVFGSLRKWQFKLQFIDIEINKNYEFISNFNKM